MLESHDPDWAAKWDDRRDRLRELDRRMADGLPDPELMREYDNIAGSMRLAFDASHRTAQDYIDRTRETAAPLPVVPGLLTARRT